ncbi:hypothetical protein TNCV_3018171 [Trichonephila clavipes]|nr:hypothetical protein TNCV_3018171 [Trichonephila clavipes]
MVPGDSERVSPKQYDCEKGEDTWLLDAYASSKNKDITNYPAQQTPCTLASVDQASLPTTPRDGSKLLSLDHKKMEESYQIGWTTVSHLSCRWLCQGAPSSTVG